jgi:hypothetical protein
MLGVNNQEEEQILGKEELKNRDSADKNVGRILIGLLF